MIKVGIECENLEDERSRYGIGQMVFNLLEEYAKDVELQKRFKLFLYFKCRIPDDALLKNPVFIKRVMHSRSFNIFYHILMPIRAWFDRLDVMLFPAYNLPPLYMKRSIVFLTEDVYYEYRHGTIPFRYKLAYKLFANWAAKFAWKILAISESSKNNISKLFGTDPKRIFVSHLGIKPRPSASSENQDYILYVGQMFPRRHVRETVLAFKNIAPEFADLKLILIGRDASNPPQIDKLVKEANKELGTQQIVHYDRVSQDDLGALYTNAKLLVYISSHEAFGLPPVEAAGYGVPVVVKDNALNHELFGDAAFFVKDDNNVEEIASTIKGGLTDKEHRSYCIQKYKELIPKFNWKNFAKNFFEACEK